jgi:membrane fusion protein (multidrug efflux system)
MSWLTDKRVLFLLMVVVIIGGLVGAKFMNEQRHGLANNREPAGGAEKKVAESTQRIPGVVANGVIAPEGDQVPLFPSVKGEVVEVLVKNDQQVKKGQVLLRMDSRQARLKLDQAEAGVKNSKVLLDMAKRGLRQWEVGRELLNIKVALAETDYERAYNLMKSLKRVVEAKTRATANEELDDATKQAERAHLAVQAAKKELQLAELKKPDEELKQAEIAVTNSELLRDEAKLGVEACELRARDDGTIMQSFVSIGSKFGDQVVRPAFLFYTGGIIVKADLQQEWAHKVKEGMPVTVEDYGGSGVTWKGKVYYIARAFLPKREAVAAFEGVNPFAQNQELVLECRIALDPDQPPAFLNQKVRVKIGQ